MGKTAAFDALTSATVTAVPETANPAVFKLTQVVDLADARFFTSGVAQNDVLPVIKVPAKTRVIAVALEVLTVAGGTCTCEVGDGDDTDGFLAAFNLNTASNFACSTLALTEAAPNTVTGYSNGKTYSAADTIDVKVLNANAAAKFKLSVLCAPF